MRRGKKAKIDRVHPTHSHCVQEKNKQILIFLWFPEVHQQEHPFTVPSSEGYTEVMTIMRCGEMLEILLRRSGASWDKWLSENSHGGKICST